MRAVAGVHRGDALSMSEFVLLLDAEPGWHALVAERLEGKHVAMEGGFRAVFVPIVAWGMVPPPVGLAAIPLFGSGSGSLFVALGRTSSGGLARVDSVGTISGYFPPGVTPEEAVAQVNREADTARKP